MNVSFQTYFNQLIDHGVHPMNSAPIGLWAKRHKRTKHALKVLWYDKATGRLRARGTLTYTGIQPSGDFAKYELFLS
jgi:hypothetical protein